ncbi:MAG: aminotransferase class IV [Caldilineaceae bacterium]|nr:aminotransferase class IV [Caldilineaceae bacterium]
MHTRRQADFGKFTAGGMAVSKTEKEETAMAQPIYYVNGNFVPAEQAFLPVNDLSIVRGYGVFDYTRSYHGKPFKLHEHILRLERSAKAIGLVLPWNTQELEGIVQATFDRNGFPDAGIRIVATGGPSDDFMTPPQTPSLVVMITPIHSSIAPQQAAGVKVTTVAMERILPTVKSINYMGAVMAVEQAKQQGAVEAIYRTPDGRLTEGTRANLFAFRGHQLLTPKDEVLAGITRAVVLEIAEDDFEVVEDALYVAELSNYDELFITSSTKEILPVIQIDDHVVANGQPGPKTQKLIELFRTYVESVSG